MAASALVIGLLATPSSAPGGMAPSGDSGAQASKHGVASAVLGRVAGAVHSERAGPGTGVAQAGRAPATRVRPEVGGSNPFPRAGEPRSEHTAGSSQGGADVHTLRREALSINGLETILGNLGQAREGLVRVRNLTHRVPARSSDSKSLTRTAGSSVLPTALSPAPSTPIVRFAVPGINGGRRTAMRTLEVALQSGGEANYVEGGDAHDRPEGDVLSRRGTDVTRRGCARARRGLAFYIAATNRWRARMGAGRVIRVRSDGDSCPRIRSLARVMRSKARAARVRYERWHWHEYAWREWLPAKWKRIIQCETGSRHAWNSGSYQGAYGFAVSSWDAFRPPGYPSEAYLATPREQWNVALAIWRRYGFSGWGCRNA